MLTLFIIGSREETPAIMSFVHVEVKVLVWSDGDDIGQADTAVSTSKGISIVFFSIE